MDLYLILLCFQTESSSWKHIGPLNTSSLCGNHVSHNPLPECALITYKRYGTPSHHALCLELAALKIHIILTACMGTDWQMLQLKWLRQHLFTHWAHKQLLLSGGPFCDTQTLVVQCD